MTARLTQRGAAILGVIVLCASTSAARDFTGAITLRSGETLTGTIRLAEFGVVFGSGIGTLRQDYGCLRIEVEHETVTLPALELRAVDAAWVQAPDGTWVLESLTVTLRDGSEVTGRPSWLLHASTASVILETGEARRVHAFPQAQAIFSPDNFIVRVVLDNGEDAGRTADTHFSRGSARHEAGAYGQALAYYATAMALDPEAVGPLLNRGSIYLETGEYEEAFADYSRVVALAPDDWGGWYGRGRALMALGDADGAVSDLTRALEADPDNAMLLLERGLAHRAAGRHAAASLDFQHAVDSASAEIAQAGPEAGFAYYERGRAHARLGKHDLAVADFDKAIAATAEPCECGYHISGMLVNRALSHLTLGALAEALRDLTDATVRDPNPGDAFLSRGVAWVARKDIEWGIERLSEAMLRNPAATDMWVARTLLRYINKDRTRAWSDLQAAEAAGARVAPRFREAVRRAAEGR